MWCPGQGCAIEPSLLVPTSLHTETFARLDLFIPFGQIPRRKKMVGPLGSYDLLGTLATCATVPRRQTLPVFWGRDCLFSVPTPSTWKVKRKDEGVFLVVLFCVYLITSES